jgi:CheY-like chemotaxis protein
VLVIDDDPTSCAILARKLAGEGIRVVGATNGEEGLRAASELHPDVITLDILMGGMSGWEVLSRLKSNPKLADIPVIMLTVMDEKRKGMSLGVSEYLLKPADSAELAGVVSGYLGSPLSARGGVLLVDDDAITRRRISQSLRERGWTVREAENGRHGLVLLQQRVPDLIVLDLVMPEMDGFAFLEHVRKSPAFCAVPVVVFTSKNLSAAERALLNGGAARVMNKNDDTLDDLAREVSTQLIQHAKDEAHGQNFVSRR